MMPWRQTVALGLHTMKSKRVNDSVSKLLWRMPRHFQAHRPVLTSTISSVHCGGLGMEWQSKCGMSASVNLGIQRRNLSGKKYKQIKGDPKIIEYRNTLIAYEKTVCDQAHRIKFQPKYQPTTVQGLVVMRESMWKGEMEKIPLQYEMLLFHVMCEAQEYSHALDFIPVVLARGGDATTVYSQFILVEAKVNGLHGAMRILDEMETMGLNRVRRTYSQAIHGLSEGEGSLSDGFALLDRLNADKSVNTDDLTIIDESLIMKLLRLKNRGDLSKNTILERALKYMRDNCILFSMEGLQQLESWFTDGLMSHEAVIGDGNEWKWDIHIARASAGGVCQDCGSQFSGVLLSEENRAALATEIGALLDDRAVRNLKPYMKKYDVVVDGLNVCYDQTPMTRQRWSVGKIRTLLQQLSKEGSSPLVTVRGHVFHSAKGADRAYLENLRKERKLLLVSEGISDDLVWLLVSMWNGMNTIFVSNDHLRDHLFKIRELSPYLQPVFRLWRDSHQVHHQYNRGEWFIGVPRAYELITQWNEDLTSIHFPLTTITSGSPLMPTMNDRWMCVTRKKT
eukprot:CFRG8546T1